jgi:protein-disulfide isomerase
MKSTYLICAVALLSLAACNKVKEAAPTDTSASVYKPVPPPADGDWTKIVIPTPAGGFMMGNPTAKVHLIEIGALSCPHCQRFDEAGVGPLIDNYVKTGKVSYEFRNYMLSGLDLAPSLIARCNGPQSFFALTRALYKDQPNWVGKAQSAPEGQFDALANLPPNQVGGAWAKLLGLQDWAALRGVPVAKSTQCLANAAEVDRLVRMTQDVRTQYPEFPGTPSFVINGRMVDLEGVTEPKIWPTLEARLKESL